MTTVVASSIPISASETKISEFFSFCGKIKSTEVIEKTDKTKTLEVTFEKPSAVSTALLLNGAEFEGSTIEVKTSTPEVSEPNDAEEEPDHNTESGKDIDQESKPKSQVIAELLANGYVLQSSLVDKAVKFDQEKGISTRFKKFISDLDSKYHLSDKNEKISKDAGSKLNQMYDSANSQFGLQDHWDNGLRTLNSYADKFKKDKYGSQVHDFYKNVSKDAKSVHDEATRLAELKKPGSTQFHTQTISSIAPDSSTAQAAAAVPFEEDKK